MTNGQSAGFNSGARGLRPRGRKWQKSKKAGYRTRGARKQRTQPLPEQSIGESAATVPCQICGHLVDPKRLHFHMVRFHGAAFRPQRP